MLTFHKLPTGEWVTRGTASQLKPGAVVDVTKRSGKTCAKTIDHVTSAGGDTVYGYFTDHCKADSRAIHDRRIEDGKGNG